MYFNFTVGGIVGMYERKQLNIFTSSGSCAGAFLLSPHRTPGGGTDSDEIWGGSALNVPKIQKEYKNVLTYKNVFAIIFS